VESAEKKSLLAILLRQTICIKACRARDSRLHVYVHNRKSTQVGHYRIDFGC
jgi:hypothetical protein